MNLKTFLFSLILVCFVLKGEAQQTYYELSGYKKTPKYEQTMEYARMLADKSPQISYTSIGKSPQGRDILMLILDKDGLSDVQAIRAKNRAVILVEACIHAGEPDGKDAGLMFLRDVALQNKYPGILDNVSLLFIPVFNVDGHEDFGPFNRINQNGPQEMGTRATAQRLNLNRDFVKADAPEMRAWLKMFHAWMPEVFVDVHVTNGADFQYVVTYGLDECGYCEKPVLDWSKNVFEKQLAQNMKSEGFPIFPYFAFKKSNDPSQGIIVDNFTPQYSNGYVCSLNRIGLLLENHIYKPYKQRVDATYKIIRNTMEIVGANRIALQKAIAEADAYTCSAQFRKDTLALSYKTVYKDSAAVDFLAWQRKTVKSDLSGGEWTIHDYNSPITVPSYIYTSYEKDAHVVLPEAYIISAECRNVIEMLDVHNIKYQVLPQEQSFEVETYRFIGSEWSKTPYEGRNTVKAEYRTDIENIIYPKGSVIVRADQPGIKIVAHMLEPVSPTSLLYWGFFNGFVRYSSEFWVSLPYMEVKGREMLAKDPVLKQRFTDKKQNDPLFASNPNAILQFFMDELRKNVEPKAGLYPVGRIVK